MLRRVVPNRTALSLADEATLLFQLLEAPPQGTIGKAFVVLGVQCVPNLGPLHSLGVLLQDPLDAFERCSDFGPR